MTVETNQLQDILSTTFEDHRLSRSEKHALREVLGEMQLTAEQMAFIRNHAFELVRQSLESHEQHLCLDWLEDVLGILASTQQNQLTGTSSAFFSDEHDCAATLERLLIKVRRSLDICLFTITHNQLAGPIRDAHKRGVKVRIITDDQKMEDLGSDIQSFIDTGIEVRTDNSEYHMHHKFAIVDRSKLINGSYNWTYGAARQNKENFIISHDPLLLRDFQKAFDRLWNEFGSTCEN